MTVEPANTINMNLNQDQGVNQIQEKAAHKVVSSTNEGKHKIVQKPNNGSKSLDDIEADNLQVRNSEQGEKKLKSAVTEVNTKIKQSRSQVEFTYHKEVNRVSIKVIDSETQEIIREIPPEDTIEMIKKMWEIAGLLVDKKL